MDLQSLLAALTGSDRPSQHQRLLRLHTTLGPDVLLAERAEIIEGIGPGLEGSDASGFRMRMTALSVRADLALPELIGQPVLLELLTAASGTALRPWHGHVTAFALLGSDGGLARYELTIEPWFAFLRWRQDSHVFQDMTVMEIVEAVFARYREQGRLVPSWRWELADRAVYPRRSLCIQYQESDLDFVSRLLAEEGLCAWFEHEGEPLGQTLGAHTLVIADHNGAFRPGVTPRVRYTQSGSAAFKEDGLQRWQAWRAAAVHEVSLASFDYRDVDRRPVTAATGTAADVPLLIADVPGLYAYEDRSQGERLATRWLEALQGEAQRWSGEGTVRDLAPGRQLEVVGHPVPQPGPFVVLQVRHLARNNLAADAAAQVLERLGEPPAWSRLPGRMANDGDEPVYRCKVLAQPLSLPVRAAASRRGLHSRPTVWGGQTAIVVGEGPVHTDRDHRIKIQFHWQRGGRSSHDLPSHGDACNAPAGDASFTWVRVAEPLAGANWGTHFTPRVGQEVVVSFLDGDIDRPVVTGVVYNGQGAADAQGNRVATGTAGTSGNAPAWFPGEQAAGHLQGHRHGAVFTGYKSQELESSSQGLSGYNQLVFDATPGGERIELSSTSAATRLQLGQLLHQQDNQRLQPRGHGLDLSTQACGALRAGAGLLLSAHARPPSSAAGQQMDSLEPRGVLEAARALARTLTDSAHAHQARLPAEANGEGLAAVQAQQALIQSLAHRAGRCAEGQAPDAVDSIGGGQGTHAAFARPDLVMAAPAGIACFTPATLWASAGGTAGLVAGQDLTFSVQRHHTSAAREGIVWFTYGKAGDPRKPNQETGMKLHAASGSVSVQAQSAASRWQAQGRIDITSTHEAVEAAAPGHVLLTAGGSALRIASSGITLTTPGPAVFKAAVKELTGAGRASADPVALAPAKDLFDECFRLTDRQSGQPLAYFRYRIEDDSGQVLARGITDAEGKTVRVHTANARNIRLLADED
ncbi:MAG TPA: type VI secretion system tip protein TssI/VgrG [Burkholderiaceae bacterium]|nr:type VI secretion system tip protein TssI/VgrG [Burkholderiaceae bacterium]